MRCSQVCILRCKSKHAFNLCAAFVEHIFRSAAATHEHRCKCSPNSPTPSHGDHSGSPYPTYPSTTISGPPDPEVVRRNGDIARSYRGEHNMVAHPSLSGQSSPHSQELWAYHTARRHTIDGHSREDDRRHVCPHCDKRFNRPSSLATHINTHTGAKRSSSSSTLQLDS